jgi:hypothetical protein
MGNYEDDISWEIMLKECIRNVFIKEMKVEKTISYFNF